VRFRLKPSKPVGVKEEGDLVGVCRQGRKKNLQKGTGVRHEKVKKVQSQADDEWFLGWEVIEADQTEPLPPGPGKSGGGTEATAS